jgi:molybdate transport repressor ModE-like protein
MERPTMRQLEILAEVARVGTFRGAARNLGLSQVAVSDHVRQLEARLGCALFVRKAGGKPTLSPSGRIVLEHGRNVLFACDSLISAARSAAGIAAPEPAVDDPVEAVVLSDIMVRTEVEGAAEPVRASLQALMPDASREEGVKELPEEVLAPTLPGANEKPITIASHPAILSRFQDKLAAAQEAFPDRPIAVDARFTSDTVAGALQSGRVDIALFYALGEVEGLQSDYLWSESWSLFARADHPLAQAEMLRVADCVDMPVILFADANPLRALCEACLEQAGLWPAPTVLETDDFAAIATELLEYGEAVFPAFGVTAAQFAARQGLKRLALIEPLPGVQVRRAVAPMADEDPTIFALAGLLG